MIKDFSDLDGKIWVNGEFVEWNEAHFHLLTHTFHYGYGVFEGVRSYASDKGVGIFRLNDHTKRMLSSARNLNLKIPYSRKEINRAQLDILKENNLSNAYIRPMCFCGTEGIGMSIENLSVNIMIAAWEWGNYLGDNAKRRGVKLLTSSFKKESDSVLSKSKINGSYVTSVLATDEAVKKGADEALLLDQEGNIAECSVENIFIVKNKKIFTPDLSAVLAGITRDTVISLAEAEGYPVTEGKLTLEDAYAADEMFMTGTAAEIVPVNKLDDQTIGNGTPGKITRTLQKRYKEAVLGYSSWKQWVTYL